MTAWRHRKRTRSGRTARRAFGTEPVPLSCPYALCGRGRCGRTRIPDSCQSRLVPHLVCLAFCRVLGVGLGFLVARARDLPAWRAAAVGGAVPDRALWRVACELHEVGLAQVVVVGAGEVRACVVGVPDAPLMVVAD